jgi:hypothetical protein
MFRTIYNFFVAVWLWIYSWFVPAITLIKPQSPIREEMEESAMPNNAKIKVKLPALDKKGAPVGRELAVYFTKWIMTEDGKEVVDKNGERTELFVDRVPISKCSETFIVPFDSTFEARVRAVDARDNWSPYSDPLLVEVIDTFPPPTPGKVCARMWEADDDEEVGRVVPDPDDDNKEPDDDDAKIEPDNPDDPVDGDGDGGEEGGGEPDETNGDSETDGGSDEPPVEEEKP